MSTVLLRNYPQVGNVMAKIVYLTASNLWDALRCQQQTFTTLHLLSTANLCENSSKAAPVSEPESWASVQPSLVLCLIKGEVAACGQSGGRHPLGFMSPLRGRVSSVFNGPLYSMPVRKLGGTAACRLVETAHRIPTYPFAPLKHVDVNGDTQQKDRRNLMKLISQSFFLCAFCLALSVTVKCSIIVLP